MRRQRFIPFPMDAAPSAPKAFPDAINRIFITLVSGVSSSQPLTSDFETGDVGAAFPSFSDMCGSFGTDVVALGIKSTERYGLGTKQRCATYTRHVRQIASTRAHHAD